MAAEAAAPHGRVGPKETPREAGGWARTQMTGTELLGQHVSDHILGRRANCQGTPTTQAASASDVFTKLLAPEPTDFG